MEDHEALQLLGFLADYCEQYGADVQDGEGHSLRVVDVADDLEASMYGVNGASAKGYARRIRTALERTSARGFGRVRANTQEVKRMWYEVYTVVGGAMNVSEDFADEDDAILFAEEQAAYLARKVKRETWEVFILPHYCDREDEESECVCAQYLTDHHPAYSSTL